MKHLLLLAIIAMFAPSYDNITEEIYINEDGSGRYSVYTNQIPAMQQLMKQQLEQNATDDTSPQDVEQRSVSNVWAEYSPKFHYTTNLLEGATAEVKTDPLQKKLLNHSVGFTIGNRAKNSINSGVMCKFDNVEELALLMELFRTNPLRDFKTKPILTNSIQLELEENKLSVQVAPTKNSAAITTKRKGTFTTYIYLPNTVKKVRGGGNKEGKKVTIENPLSDVLTGNVATEVEMSWKR